YINYYFHARDSQDAYPHIAIVDPRTGEQVKVWSGPPVPKPVDFVMELHEFLDRYSLDASAKNPVATRKSEKKTVDVNRMTEEEMLEMALKNSMASNGGPKEDDPDALTKAVGTGKGKENAVDPEDLGVMDMDPAGTNGTTEPPASESSPFSLISFTNPHIEPAVDPATTTRIQFRHSGGRVIRRFAVSDPVRRIYEWLKATPFEGKEGVNFALISLGKNLIDSLESTIEEAGLKNGTIMVEFLED
ncbi:UBX domain protein Ubx2, partial [Cryomyces antarcticus]